MKTYRYKTTDTPLSLANSFKISVPDLLKANPGVSQFSVGQTLNIPTPTPRPGTYGAQIPGGPVPGTYGALWATQTAQPFQYATQGPSVSPTPSPTPAPTQPAYPQTGQRTMPPAGYYPPGAPYVPKESTATVGSDQKKPPGFRAGQGYDLATRVRSFQYSLNTIGAITVDQLKEVSAYHGLDFQSMVDNLTKDKSLGGMGYVFDPKSGRYFDPNFKGASDQTQGGDWSKQGNWFVGPTGENGQYAERAGFIHGDKWRVIIEQDSTGAWVRKTVPSWWSGHGPDWRNG